MAQPTQKRPRKHRVAALELPPGKWRAMGSELRRGSVVVRLSLVVLTLLGLAAITRAWRPPAEFHAGQTPLRNLTARVEFKQPDDKATDEARDLARRLATAVYEHDPARVTQLKARVVNELSELASAESLDTVDPEIWASYALPPPAEGTPAPTPEQEQEQFAKLRTVLSEAGQLDAAQATLGEAFAPLERHGLMVRLPPEHEANQKQIQVRRVDSPGFDATVEISETLVENATRQLQRTFEQKLPSLDLAARVFNRIRTALPETLKLDPIATRAEQDRAEAEVVTQYKVFPVGSVLATGSKMLDEASLKLLDAERSAWLHARSSWESVLRFVAATALYGALFVVVAFVLRRHDRGVLSRLPRLVTLLATVLLTVAAMTLANSREWRAEAIPLLLLAMTAAVAYGRINALVMSAATTLIASVGLGLGTYDAVLLLGPASAAAIALDSVRTRSKLLIVGFVAAGVAAALALCVGQLAGLSLLDATQTAVRLALWSVIAASLMTCLLPLVERVFDVQTDLSLLELGDPAHPLLQELVRRAPGTYNHSITVASLAEAATESIGGRALLTRVGAYFHDIGKMLKPQYFVENQSRGDNRHQSLAPAMSTLVIIAHVKDGVDLARQHHLPERIIDFIQQHHGTTLVEYFYRQASSRKEADENAAAVDESAFRYPGPRPQTKEAAVLMIADAVESASRVLVEPTPARIESLVEELAHKRLVDGQFDECGLTLQEVSRVCDSLVKSLTAVYHGRVKYPEQEPSKGVSA
ncbi:HD family phosphohydrolase [Pirellulimonas nuda]|nr:HDIG domain-containing metalloprotein [Pirellulimonas nuda]